VARTKFFRDETFVCLLVEPQFCHFEGALEARGGLFLRAAASLLLYSPKLLKKTNVRGGAGEDVLKISYRQAE
jgi:hypothetical protein